MFKAALIKIIPIPILILSFNIFIQAQMPDWTLIEDKDNNRFYIDRNGKIWTSGKPEFDYKPVSIEGLDYYLNHGIELIKSHNKSEGLILLKSILAMPVANDVVYKAQITASKQIKNLIKIEGTRYEDLNKNASLLLFKYNDSITLFNDDMMYRINAPVFIKIISTRTRQKLNYKYHGILLGYRFLEKTVKDKSGYSGYDLLVAIDSERFPYNLKNLNNFIDNWRMRLGNDTLERTILQKNSTYIINNYKDKYSPYYSGVEGYYIKNNYGYFLKAISSLENFRKYETEIIKVINSFKI